MYIKVISIQKVQKIVSTKSIVVGIKMVVHFQI